MDFSRSSIKMALAECAGEAVRFHGITQIKLPISESGESPALDSSLVVDSLKREVARMGWQGMRAACLLPGSATSSQSFLLPPLADSEMRRAIELRLGDTLHFELDEAEFNFRRSRSVKESGTKPEMVLTAAARRETVQAGLDALKAAGLVPRGVGSAAESLANLSQCVSLWNTDQASIHVDVGSVTTVLNLFEGKQLRFSREIEIGAQAFVAALTRPIFTDVSTLELTPAQAAELLEACGIPAERDLDLPLPLGVRGSDVAPLLEPVALRLTAEIERSVDYLSGLLDRSQIDRIVLSGTGGRMRNLEQFLEDRLGTEVSHCDPVEQAISHWRLAVCGDRPEDLSGYATILGYAIGQRRPINLLPRDEVLEQAVERFSARRRAAVLPAIAASGIIALAGVPIQRDYQGAGAQLELRAAQVDREVQALDLLEQQQGGSANLADSVRAECGSAPNWMGLLKELSLLAPEGVEFETLEVDTLVGEPTAYISAWVHPGEDSFNVVTTKMITELSGSPLFRDVHVVEASISRNGEASRFELSLELIAATADFDGGVQ